MHEPVLPKPSSGENLATLCIPQVGRINTSFLISFSTTVKAELSSTGFPHSKTGKQKLWKLQGKKNSETMKKYFTFLRENCSSTLCLLYCNKLRDQNFNAHLLNASTLFIKAKHMLLPQIIIQLQLLHSRSIPSPIILPLQSSLISLIIPQSSLDPCTVFLFTLAQVPALVFKVLVPVYFSAFMLHYIPVNDPTTLHPQSLTALPIPPCCPSSTEILSLTTLKATCSLISFKSFLQTLFRHYPLVRVTYCKLTLSKCT